MIIIITTEHKCSSFQKTLNSPLRIAGFSIPFFLQADDFMRCLNMSKIRLRPLSAESHIEVRSDMCSSRNSLAEFFSRTNSEKDEDDSDFVDTAEVVFMKERLVWNSINKFQFAGTRCGLQSRPVPAEL